jgi:hypothetical protein
MNRAFPTLLRFGVIFGLTYAASAYYFGGAKAQVAPPPGTPAGVQWIQGRAGGGPVITGSTFTQYRYPTVNELPFKAEPGQVLKWTGIAVGGGLAAAGQPAAGGLIGGAIAGAASSMEKNNRELELRPVITQRDVGTMAPVVPVFGGGAIGGGGRIIKPMAQ